MTNPCALYHIHNWYITGAIADGGDLFPTDDTPKINHLNCTGNENDISDCTSNLVNIDDDDCSSSAIAICQGICMRIIYIP